MAVIKKLLSERNLPALLMHTDGTPVTAESWGNRRKEILTILENEIYGTAPEAPKSVSVTKTMPNKKKYGDFAGKATVTDLEVSFECDKGTFAFPAVEIRPVKEGRVPVFVFLNFSSDVPHRYFPVEELIDEGYAVVRIYYNDVTFDGEDQFSSGLATMYDREKYSWGKLRMWAFAASRVMDYLLTTDYADPDRIAVTGHSRLGKTSLITAAFDERFALACANNSGCAGDAITREKCGERVAEITKQFPYWFCEKYRDYVGNEAELPFDQHFLVASIAPRRVALGAALEDKWADPDSQYLSACAASEAWELLCKTGFVHPDCMPVPGDIFSAGSLSYHLRAGTHFYSRTDWRVYFDVMKQI